MHITEVILTLYRLTDNIEQCQEVPSEPFTLSTIKYDISLLLVSSGSSTMTLSGKVAAF